MIAGRWLGPGSRSCLSFVLLRCLPSILRMNLPYIYGIVSIQSSHSAAPSIRDEVTKSAKNVRSVKAILSRAIVQSICHGVVPLCAGVSVIGSPAGRFFHKRNCTRAWLFIAGNGQRDENQEARYLPVWLVALHGVHIYRSPLEQYRQITAPPYSMPPENVEKQLCRVVWNINFLRPVYKMTTGKGLGTEQLLPPLLTTIYRSR